MKHPARKTIARLCLSAVLALCAQGASAQFDVLDSSFGADTLILDTSTGLEWLRLDVTFGRSYFDVGSNLGPGQDFAGFSFASTQQLYTVFTPARGFSANQQIYPSQPPTAAQSAQIVGLIEMFGGPTFANGGLLTGNTNRARLGCPPIDECTKNYSTPFWAGGFPGSWGFTVDDATGPNGDGSWLVAVVPEPATYALMLAGLAGIGVLLLRRLRRDRA
ncbi:MAG TPA: PEP-CTERM sorting domain-containing protein [Albitalea sp.]|nr:PEP-CTERM sorting domain-containing protein [Albitalea sp.]HJW12685.1 PEP-CTERM sorting domain-containing protein [Albitalea sp.]